MSNTFVNGDDYIFVTKVLLQREIPYRDMNAFQLRLTQVVTTHDSKLAILTF